MVLLLPLCLSSTYVHEENHENGSTCGLEKRAIGEKNLYGESNESKKNEKTLEDVLIFLDNYTTSNLTTR
jgi:hypothetical protein